jgi:hypothetical protein
MRGVLALVVVVLLAGLASGCGSSGGGGSTTTSAAALRAEQQWQVGLRRWGHDMRGALDGLSQLFSSPAAVRAIEASQAKMNARLAVLEATLDHCTTRIRALGPAPAQYELAHRYAIQACKNLERGSRLVKAGVKQFQGGLGVDIFSDSTEPLSNGQDYVGLATSHLGSVAAG